MISWRNSIVTRYAVVSFLIALAPVLFIAGAYDRYSQTLIDALTGERLDRRLLAMSSRMNGFIEARTTQLDTLANYPGIAALVNPHIPAHDESGLHTVVELESSQPDLYGILLFGRDGVLASSVPGQSASGPPYWGNADERFLMAAKNAEGKSIIGPFAPEHGRPGSFLMIRPIPGPMPDSSPEGWIALHVRLASLAEIMSGDNSRDFFQTVLLTPEGGYNNVGVAIKTPDKTSVQPLMLDGWGAGLSVEADRFIHPLNAVRNYIILLCFLVPAILVVSFIILARRLKAPIKALVEGSQAIAEGNLSWRLDVKGENEIAALSAAFNQMAERLQKTIKSAVESEKMAALGHFATSLAHELRNPLSTVKTTVQALLTTEPIGERRDILHNVEDEIDRLDKTLHELLMYARPRPARTQSIIVWDLLERMNALTSKLLTEHRISLVTLGEPDMEIRGDPDHLKQIVINLILNALHAMPNGGLITMRLSRRDRFGVIEITDTGSGMTEETMARVTEPFFTTRPDGTGLGLSVSRQLVEMNGGALEFASAPGEGTTAIIRLPLAEK